MTKTTTEMQRSYLVQRLEKPRGSAAGPFTFGGGLHNGGLSDEALGLLRDVFSFDYMGSAEFEFGAVPQALSGIAKDCDDLVAWSFTIPLAEVKPDWRAKKEKAPSGDATLYALSRAAHRVEVEDRVRGFARDGYEARLKEATHLDRTLRPFSEYDGRAVGWLELDNGFFFFTDREMWQRTAALFGVEVGA